MSLSLKSFFNSALDLLRGNENQVGQIALNSIIPFVTYYHLEKIITEDDMIDAQEIVYGFDNDGLLDYKWLKYSNHKTYVFQHNKDIITNKASRDANNIIESTKRLMKVLLKKLPKTRNLYELLDFNLTNGDTIVKLYELLDKTNFDDVHVDTLGDLYEGIIKMFGGTSKGLGQFFTPYDIRKLMIQMVAPKRKENGELETIYDPAMGSGGFLLSTIEHYKSIGATNQEISNAIGGVELVPNTYTLACANILMVLGLLPEKCIQADSMKNYNSVKPDIILMNPPFAIKFKYEELRHQSQYYVPIKTNDSVMVFLQIAIHMLPIGGRCVLVCPNGKQLNNKQYSKIREYLCRTCEVLEVRDPGAEFANTGVKTVLISFVKRVDEKNVLKLGRDISFVGTPIQQNIIMGDVIVSTDMLEQKEYRLDIGAYRNTNETKIQDNTTVDRDYEVTMYKLGDICHLENGKQLDRKDMIDGEYPVYGGGSKIVGTHNDYNREKCTVVAGTGNPGLVSFVDTKFWASQCFTIQSNNTSILNNKYLYYYTKYNLEDHFKESATGTAQKFIRANHFHDLCIPIPPLHIQQQIVSLLDNTQSLVEESKKKINRSKELMNSFISNMISTCKIKYRLSDVMQLNKSGKTNSTDASNTGEFPFYRASVENPSGSHSSYDFDGDGYILIVKSGGNKENPISRNHAIGKVFLVHGKCAANIAVFKLDLISNKVILKYMYCILDYLNPVIQSFARYATGNGNIDMNELMNIEIPVVPIHIQEQIVKFCDIQTNLIRSLEQEIDSYTIYNKCILDSYTNISNVVEAPIIEHIPVATPSTTKSVDKTKVLNPITNKYIIVNSPTFKKLIKDNKCTYDEATNMLHLVESTTNEEFSQQSISSDTTTSTVDNTPSSQSSVSTDTYSIEQVNTMSYKELQSACKNLKLSAKGKSDILRQQLLDHISSMTN